MQGLYFVYFYKTYFYIFSNVLYLHVCLDLWDVFMWTGNLRTLFCLTKRWQFQIIYIPVYMKVNYLYTLCLFKVDWLFYKLAIPKYICVFVTKLSKEKKYFMFGWTWEIEDKTYYLLLTWVFVWDSAPYFHSSVSNVDFVLWGRGAINIFCMPRCRFNVLNYRKILIIGR
jgi:hypothetical protein